MYDYYSDVHDREEPHFLSLRSTVLDRKQPRRMFAQHNTVLEGKSYPVFYVHYHCYQSVSIPSPLLRKILMLLGNITVDYSPPSGVHGSVVIGVKPITKRSLVQTLLWSLFVVFNAHVYKRHFIYIGSVHQYEIGYWFMLGVNLRWFGVPSRSQWLSSI